MYWYILFPLIVVAILCGVLIYYYTYEGFQSSSTEVDLSGAVLRSPDHFDLSGVNVEKIAHDVSGILQDATVDRRPVDSGERLCEGLLGQISAMEQSMKHYRNADDWANVRITTSAIQALKKQRSEAGCKK